VTQGSHLPDKIGHCVPQNERQDLGETLAGRAHPGDKAGAYHAPLRISLCLRA